LERGIHSREVPPVLQPKPMESQGVYGHEPVPRRPASPAGAQRR
jgi:hypothetical protein